MAALANALKNSDNRLEVLHLEDNDLAAEGGRALAPGVWQCHCLRELHLGNTGIGDEGAKPRDLRKA